MPKTEFLCVRLEPKDYEKMKRIAEQEMLPLAMWARRVLLRAVQEIEEVEKQDR